MSTETSTEEPRACRTCRTVKAAEEFRLHQGRRYVHCRDCMRAREREKYRASGASGVDKVFDQSLRRLYGITLAQYRQMETAQNGLCAICGEAPTTKKRLHVDHDHATGQIRALLCHHCNLLLGNARDSIPRLRQAIAYLERHAP